MPGTDTDGQAPAGAKVIQFPTRFRAVPEAVAPAVTAQGADDPASRLDRALLGLNQALVRQQVAVQEWRQNLERLAGSVGTLTNSLHALDAGLEAASERLRTGPVDQATDKPVETT
jgi:uncharacterized coiled-coil protein SlyX